MIAVAIALSLAAPTALPPEVAAAKEAWNACLQSRLDSADRKQRPSQIVDAMILACTPQQEAMVSAHRRWLAGSDLSERDRKAAAQMMDGMVTGTPRMLKMFLRTARDR